jgi:flagella basal body P-ring formation protein FlgA
LPTTRDIHFVAMEAAGKKPRPAAASARIVGRGAVVRRTMAPKTVVRKTMVRKTIKIGAGRSGETE